MSSVSFELVGGVTLSLPSDIVAQRLIESLRTHHVQAIVSNAKPKIGEYISEQGGIYVGDILGDDGTLYGLIAAKENDVGKATFGKNGTLNLSSWDGLSNTNELHDQYPAAKLASDYKRDGHFDFYLPARRELIVAIANVPNLFRKEGWYWSSTPYRENQAWAVVFEHGYVDTCYRRHEFRVRPFRRFTH